MVAIFDFDSVQEKFTRLLNLNWQESSEKGWYRVAKRGVSDRQKQDMIDINKIGSFSFTEGESPSLGQTYIIDPGKTNQFGSYKFPASAAFVSAYDQVKVNHHSIEKAAQGLVLNAYLQSIYRHSGTDISWGQWSMGLNQNSFNSYKFSNSNGESLFLQRLDNLLDRQAKKTNVPLISERKINYITQQTHMKVVATDKIALVLSPVYESLIDLAKTAEKRPQDLDAAFARNTLKLGL